MNDKLRNALAEERKAGFAAIERLQNRLRDCERDLAELREQRDGLETRCKRMSIAHAELEANCAALVEAVRWMLECLDAWLMTRMMPSFYAEMEALECYNLARAAVDALVGE